MAGAFGLTKNAPCFVGSVSDFTSNAAAPSSGVSPINNHAHEESHQLGLR